MVEIPQCGSNRSQWKVLILDGGSKKLVDGTVREDDILKENVTSISSENKIDRSRLKAARHRTNRGQETTQPRNGRNILSLATASYCGLLNGRFRASAVSQIFCRMDIM